MKLTTVASATVIEPGDTFSYEFSVICSSIQFDCVNAVLTAEVPEGLVVDVVQPPFNATYSFDESTRIFSAVFTDELSDGQLGLAAGGQRVVSLNVTLPDDTELMSGTLTNTATVDSDNSAAVSSSASVEVQVPVVTPTALKAWTPNRASALSEAASAISLTAVNESLVGANVTSLNISDLSAETFQHFNITAVGPVEYPGGADQIEISTCTKTSGCTTADLASEGIFQGTGPFTLKTPLDQIAGIAFRFSNSSGATLLPDTNGGSIELGVRLRDLLRSNGAPIIPGKDLKVTNTMTSSVTAGGQEVLGSSASAVFTIVPVSAPNAVDPGLWSAGDPTLGFLDSRSNTVTAVDSPRCPRLDYQGTTYTSFPCAARNAPGQGFDYIFSLENRTPNSKLLKVRFLDSLPALGDKGIVTPSLSRGTTWPVAPRLLQTLQAGVGTPTPASGYTTFDTVAGTICFDLLQGGTTPDGCQPASWTAQFPAEQPGITAVYSDVKFGDRDALESGEKGYLSLRLGSALPTPTTLGDWNDNLVAWNLIAAEPQLRKVISGVVLPSFVTQPKAAGQALAFGQVQVTKLLERNSVAPISPAAEEAATFAGLPGPFKMEYRCEATTELVGGGVSAPQVVAEGTLDVNVNQRVDIPGPLPAGAVCKVWETDSLGLESSNLGEENAVSVTVLATQIPGETRYPQLVEITNTFTPAISLDKSVEPGLAVVGQEVTYTFVATNTGNIALSDVVITDPLVGLSALTCDKTAPVTLAPTEQLTCTATYTVTPADLASGSVTNTATTTGRPPLGPNVTDSDSAKVVVLRASIDLVKSADVVDVQAVGDPVVYTFVATNTGEVDLTSVQITDPLEGLSALSCDKTDPVTLAPGEKLTCTATYAVTQEDLDKGAIVNTATATGQTAGGPVTDTDDETVPVAKIDLVKTADVTEVDAVGDAVTYTFIATNTGNVVLTDVKITDPMEGLSALTCDQTGQATLQPGEKLTCTATYEVTQADLDNGLVDNTATATGQTPGGNTVTDMDDETVPVAKIDLVKTADVTEVDAVGDVVTYTFVATNTGNVALSDVVITDPLPGLSVLSCDKAAPVTLAPTEQLTCTATYSVTQADLDNGLVENVATTTGQTPGGATVTDKDDETVPVAKIDLVKTADVTEVDAVGDVITYTFVATNTGNVALSNVVITDPLPGLSALTCDKAAPVTLEPGATLTCTATYKVTQADLDNGLVENVATATGQTPGGGTVTDKDDETVPVAKIDVVKTADVTEVDAVGDVITYTFVATNTGNVVLSNVVITDPLPGLSALTCDKAAPVTLAPTEQLTCTATYAVTQEDLDNGGVTNVATATGETPGGGTVTDKDDETVPAPKPGVDVIKTADVTTVDSVGDVITYTFVATNTGNVVLTNVEITDPLPGLSPLSCDRTAPVTLQPGEKLTCTATYRVTQADLDAGSVQNVATVTGETPGGDKVTDKDDETVPVERDSLTGTGAGDWTRTAGVLALVSIFGGLALLGWSRRRGA